MRDNRRRQLQHLDHAGRWCHQRAQPDHQHQWRRI